MESFIPNCIGKTTVDEILSSLRRSGKELYIYICTTPYQIFLKMKLTSGKNITKDSLNPKKVNHKISNFKKK